MTKIVYRLAGLLALLAGATTVLAQEKQPVFIYLFSRYSDYANIEMTESRIRDTVGLVAKYRRAYSDTRPAMTVLFSGALSQALAERNAKTGIKDFVLDAARQGVIEIGWDGTDEPTYSFRPLPKLASAKSPEQRWSARGDAAGKFLTELRDPATGQVVQGRSGGLKAMQEVFGEAVCIRGLTAEFGGDSEYVLHLRRLNTKAILWGLPDPNESYNIHGYRGSVEQFGKAMSPLPNSSPEVNWIDNRLRLSETSDAAVHVVSGNEGPEGIKKVLQKLDRSHVRFVHVELGDDRMYLSQFYEKGTLYPPIKVAFEHPNTSKLPQEAFAEELTRDEALVRQDALMKYLAQEYMPANGSRFVSSTDLARMAPSNIGQNLSVPELERGVQGMLKEWGDLTYLPDYLKVGDQYLSMADAFVVLSEALAERQRAGRLPSAVTLHQVYGPLDMAPSDHGPVIGEVTSAAAGIAAVELAGKLKDETWREVPNNILPTWVSVGGIQVTAGQFIRLMAESLVAPSAESKLRVKMTYLFSGQGLGYPKHRMSVDQGGTMTFKPAPLNLASLRDSK